MPNVAEIDWKKRIKSDLSLSYKALDNLFLNFREQTEQESAFVPDSVDKPYNTDDLFKKDSSYAFYEDMLKDDQVYAVVQLKKDIVLGSGWEIESQEDGQEEIVADIERMFREDIDAPLEDLLEEVLSAYEFGFSMTEKIFKRREDGSVTLKTLKTRHPGSWVLHTDSQGNIRRYEQQGSNKNLDVNPKILIHYINNRKFQNPYGTSDLRAAYSAYFLKQHVHRFYAIFLEKAASPVPIGRYDKNAPDEAVDTLFNTLKTLQSKSVLVLPKPIELDWMESKSNGEVFIKGLNISNLMIGRAVLLPDLSGVTGSETAGGSYSLGKEQLDLFFMHVRRRRQTIEWLIDNALIKPVVIANFGVLEHFPKFRFKPIRGDAAAQMAEMWFKAVSGKTYKPTPEEVNHFRQLIEFPTSDDVEFFPDAAPNPGFAPPNAQDTPLQPLDNEGVADENLETELDEDMDKMQSFQKDDSNFEVAFKLPEGDFHNRTDFKAIESQMNTFQKKLMSDLLPITDEIFLDMLNQIETKKIIKNQNIEKISEIKLKKLGTVKQIIKKALKQNFEAGMSIAQAELMGKRKFRTPLASEDFLKSLEDEVFQFVGDWEFQVTKKARTELIAAIKDGKPLSSVLDILDNEGKALSDQQLERYARTKFTETMNRGRLASFEESGVVDGYQYSAVLDGRTTDICRGLDGKFFEKGTEPVPPLHFNCRSLLVPITRFQNFTPTENIEVNKDTLAPVKSKTKKSKTISIPEFIDKKKGKGFSAR